MAPADFFLFPKLKSTLKDDDLRYGGKFADGATRDPEKGVPGPFPEVATALGVAHHCRRGVF
jgi:hypothetical protein